MTEPAYQQPEGEPSKEGRGWQLYESGDRFILQFPKGDEETKAWRQLVDWFAYAIHNGLDFGFFYEVPNNDLKIESLAMICLSAMWVRQKDITREQMAAIKGGEWLAVDGDKAKQDA